MVSYEEDDLIDYEERLPDFENEGDLDDYLNDDEYELMNEVLPVVKKEMENYQGWDDFALKKAIFENNFDSAESLKKLKKTFKKKKSEVSLGSSSGLSRLEQLARARAAQNNGSITKTSGDKENRSISLLSKLRGTTRSSQQLPKSTLSEKLKASRTKISVNVNRSGGDSNSLGSRISELRKNERLGMKSTENKGISIPSRSSQESKCVDPWEAIKGLRHGGNSHNVTSPKIKDFLVLATIVVEGVTVDKSSENLRKRNYDEMFASYYPASTYFDTNSTEAAKTKAIKNFKKPSRDDVVLEAQAKALDNVTENVSKLKLEEENKMKMQQAHAPKLAKKPTKPFEPIDVHHYISESKPHCSFVVVGHVDSGKSTLMGRLLYDSGVVEMNELRKLKRESEIVGKSSFHLAWIMDQTPEERERGVTVSVCTNDFETSSTRFTVVDAPGHRDFIPNTIGGISEADIAVLSIDCGTDAFEVGFNLDGQTKEHSLLARSLGVSRIVVAMNKMDTIDWYQQRFEQIKNELSSFFEAIGYRREQVSWIPCSGLSGVNVVKRDLHEVANWYKGRSLLEELEFKAGEIGTSYQEDVDNSPFLFSITEVISVNKNEEIVVSGKVESGSIQPGETLNVFPSEQSVVVNRITRGDDEKKVPVCIKGDFAVLRLREAFPEIIEAGDLAASVGVEIPVKNILKVQALTFQMELPLLPGTSLMFFKGVNEYPVRVHKLISIIDKQDPSQVLKKRVRHLGSNQAAIFELELIGRGVCIPLLTSAQSKRINRFVLRREGRTIAAGTIIE